MIFLRTTGTPRRSGQHISLAQQSVSTAFAEHFNTVYVWMGCNEIFSLAEGVRGEKRKRDPEDEGEEEDD